ncbi:hypothetical protein [Haloechinothrix salitolerans]|uniref:Uncharacterized protein n=1 Tax=Haloechinothrix salitolerans TaxID=926830 RepID=A0ABW2C1Y3_9PSEU
MTMGENLDTEQGNEPEAGAERDVEHGGTTDDVGDREDGVDSGDESTTIEHTADEPPALCALDGCDNPLPPRPVDQHGRRKGGRPSSYCCKSHADAASRARRVAQAAAVIDPLSDLRQASESLSAVTTPVVEAITALQERFSAAEEGAIAQVRRAEEEAGAARSEAEDAVARAERSDRARNAALVQAREDRQAREKAEKAAVTATAEAEAVTKQAWEKVAEHERAAGAADAARVVAENARDELAATLRSARAELDALREEREALRRERDEARTELEEQRSEVALLSERLSSARAQQAAAENAAEHARKEVARTQDQAAELVEEARRQRADRDDALNRLAEEHAARRVAEQTAEAAQATVESLRTALAEANARVDTLLGSQRSPNDITHESAEPENVAVSTERAEG